MLQEETSTIVLLILVATASANPQSNLHSGKVVIITLNITIIETWSLAAATSRVVGVNMY